jgi:hypothetical protein
MEVMTKKSEVKTVTFDVEETHRLLTLAAAATGFPKYSGIAEAANRMLAKVEQDLEDKLTKVHEEEAKATAEAEMKKAIEARQQEGKGKAA